MTTADRLYRSTQNRMVCGVSGGIAEYFGVDVGLVRLGWVFLAFCTAGFAILGYALLCLVLPEEETADGRSAETSNDWSGHAVGSASRRTSSKELAEEARLLLEVKRELGDDYDEQLVDAFAQKVEESLKARRGDARGGQQKHRGSQRRKFLPMLLLAGGALLLFAGYGASWSFWAVLWLVILIGAGAALLSRRAIS